MDNLGIGRVLSSPYTLQQNGLIEREIRTVTEAARTMLLHAKLDKEFWAEAVNTAVYVLNRVTPKSGSKTPYEMWFGHKPNLGNLRVFGQHCIVLLPEGKRRKFDPKGIEGRMLGYTGRQNTYRVLDTRTMSVMVSSDVFFLSETDAEKDVLDFYDQFNHQNENSEVLVTIEDSKDSEAPNETISGFIDDDYLQSTSTPREGMANKPTNIVMDDSTLTETQPGLLTDTIKSTIDQTSSKPGGSSHIQSKKPSSSQAQPSKREPVPLTTGINKVKPSRISTSNVVGTKLRTVVPQARQFQAKGGSEKHHLTLATVSTAEEPETYLEAITRPDADKWIEAMKHEMSSIRKKKVWDIVKRPSNTNIVSSKWIFKLKKDTKGNIVRYKARLVARGFSDTWSRLHRNIFTSG